MPCAGVLLHPPVRLHHPPAVVLDASDRSLVVRVNDAAKNDLADGGGFDLQLAASVGGFPDLKIFVCDQRLCQHMEGDEQSLEAYISDFAFFLHIGVIEQDTAAVNPDHG